MKMVMIICLMMIKLLMRWWWCRRCRRRRFRCRLKRWWSSSHLNNNQLHLSDRSVLYSHRFQMNEWSFHFDNIFLSQTRWWWWWWWWLWTKRSIRFISFEQKVWWLFFCFFFLISFHYIYFILSLSLSSLRSSSFCLSVTSGCKMS